MNSTAATPLRSVAPLAPTATATATGDLACLAEVEAWLLDVAPVVAALRQAPAVPSPGQHRWLVRLMADADQALRLLGDAEADALAHDEPTDALEWLETRVAAALDGALDLLAADPAAA